MGRTPRFFLLNRAASFIMMIHLLAFLPYKQQHTVSVGYIHNYIHTFIHPHVAGLLILLSSFFWPIFLLSHSQYIMFECTFSPVKFHKCFNLNYPLSSVFSSSASSSIISSIQNLVSMLAICGLGCYLIFGNY